jgi:prepilin-type N-terminal cleavage/methylation domain-containing protein
MTAAFARAAQPRRGRAAHGFTLPEALATLMVVSALSVMAVPMIRDMVQNYRIKTASFELFLTLNYARSEAIKRAGPVTITPMGSGWESGWRILDQTGKVIKLQPGFAGGVQIAGPDNLVYEKDGRLPQAGTTAAFDVAIDNQVSSAQGRCVRVDLAGRPATRKGGC